MNEQPTDMAELGELDDRLIMGAFGLVFFAIGVATGYGIWG